MPNFNKLFDKFEPEHISKWIESNDKESKRDFILRLFENGQSIFYTLLICVVLVMTAKYFFPKDPDTFKEILKMLVLFGGGVGTGYGLGKRKRNAGD